MHEAESPIQETTNLDLLFADEPPTMNSNAISMKSVF